MQSSPRSAVPVDIGGKNRLTLTSKMSGCFTIEDLTGSTDGIADGGASKYAVNPRESLRRTTERDRNKIIDMAATKFNIKPKSCKEFLIAERFMQGLPTEFAAFILNHQAKLSKKRIGEFIGGEDEYCRMVCTELFSFYNFKGDTLSVALRKLCRQFRLPGEAQQIDRILETFAGMFHSQNPGVFLSSDTAFVLSFSIILLNTDLHNHSVPADRRMTLEQFIKNNRGINQGDDLSPELLTEIYNDIRSNEIIMNEGDMYETDEVAFMVPTKTGHLFKRSHSILPQWKRHWFVLNDGCLYYFLRAGDPKPRCIIPLDNTRIGRGDGDTDFIITSFTDCVVKSSKFLADGTNMLGAHPHFLFRTSSQQEREDWVKKLQEEIIKFKPLHEMFLKRKEQENSTSTTTTVLQHLIPKPIAEGWMRKRGGVNTAWKRRYFLLLPDFDHGGITLFYFVNQQIAQKMLDLGVQTQQGYLRMRHVTDLYTVKDNANKVTHIEIVTEDRVWSFQPDELTDVIYWFTHLEEAASNYSYKPRKGSSSSSSTPLRRESAATSPS